MDKVIIIGGKGAAVMIAEQIYDAQHRFGAASEFLGFAFDDDEAFGHVAYAMLETDAPARMPRALLPGQMTATPAPSRTPVAAAAATALPQSTPMGASPPGGAERASKPDCSGDHPGGADRGHRAAVADPETLGRHPSYEGAGLDALCHKCYLP